ncbi:MAG: FecR/PupR family sigma factor regulator, partial [Opitutaceae bacterium]
MHGVHAALPARAGGTLAVNESAGNPSRHEAVESAAAEWLVKHDRGFTPRQQDEFLQWLATSPMHRESFERHRQMWTDFNALRNGGRSTAPSPIRIC